MRAIRIASAALLCAAVIATPAQASTPGSITYDFGGYFATEQECVDGRDPYADKYRCTFKTALQLWELRNGYWE